MADIARTLKPGERITVRAPSPTGTYKSLPLVEVAAGDRAIVSQAAATPTPTGWSEEFGSGLGAFTAHVMTWPNGQGVDAAHVSVEGGILRLRADFAPQRGGMVLGPIFDHGYFEARVKFVAGTGLSPAFWLMRPLSSPVPWDEVDFAEWFPNASGEFFQSTVHTYPGGVNSYKQITVTKTLSGSWHTYGALLVPGQRLDIYLDGVLQGSITEGVPAQQSFHIILSHIPGNWSAQPDATTPNPAFMEVDWVRWYEGKP